MAFFFNDTETTEIYTLSLHDALTISKDVLYRNNGDGTFTDVSKEAGIHSVWGNGLGVTVGDVNDDGLLDVFVANDEMNNQLWMNQGDGTFIDDALVRSEEHTSELQSRRNLVCRLLLEKKK